MRNQKASTLQVLSAIHGLVLVVFIMAVLMPIIST
jgi:hypothetical protein